MLTCLQQLRSIYIYQCMPVKNSRLSLNSWKHNPGPGWKMFLISFALTTDNTKSQKHRLKSCRNHALFFIYCIVGKYVDVAIIYISTQTRTPMLKQLIASMHTCMYILKHFNVFLQNSKWATEFLQTFVPFRELESNSKCTCFALWIEFQDTTQWNWASTARTLHSHA